MPGPSTFCCWRIMIKNNYYSSLEERINIISHGIGFFLSIAALTLLIVFSSIYGNVWHIVSFSIFGSSLVLLYSASTFYHSAKKEQARRVWKIIDHSFVYLLIAGTYTPICLITLHGKIGWTILGISWGLAFAGTSLKLFFTGKFRKLSTILYLFMGWMIIFAVKPLWEHLPRAGFLWLLLGGVCYTVGAIFYSIQKIELNHAIFHIFVVLGSCCHFVLVFFYLLP